MPRYALIDAARSPNIWPLVQSEPEARSLFGGKIAPALAAAAPWIVPIRPGTAFKQAFQTEGWGDFWGIACFSPAPLREVRHSLRKCQQVMLPTGQPVLFRYYDPRVFVPMMRMADEGDIGPWFARVTDFWAPDPDSGATIRFLRDGKGRLRTQAMTPERQATLAARAMGSAPGSP
ncbi:DUF4123 domain-containing protein [Oceanicola sp. D3]|uniref:DUF4123 domain-containing protein n=1 Tax=Oceanicola sp. D3 TaxID=2587163 RepID=UPI00112357BB|nr:DUF4123 domain-containing protein [Oceanicola sp. D3]QDC10746.1 DUF4123 domain-containing protein [Oceanicola sp. D3]